MEGGRSYYQEDPRRRNNFTLGLHAEISARELSKWRRLEKELKMADNKNPKCNLGPSALFTGVNHYLSAELTQ